MVAAAQPVPSLVVAAASRPLAAVEVEDRCLLPAEEEGPRSVAAEDRPSLVLAAVVEYCHS